MCKPFPFLDMYRLGGKRHEVALDDEPRIFLTKEERRSANNRLLLLLLLRLKGLIALR